MKCLRSVVFTLVVGGVDLSITNRAYAAKVEETTLGRTDIGGIFALAPDEGHVAYLSKVGQHFVIQLDGVAGPEFDGILKASGRALVSFPTKVLVTPGDGSRDAKDSPVRFTYDGQHVAYVGLQGKEYVVIHDGREVGRGPWGMLEAGSFSLSFKGRYAYWTEFSVQEGKTFRRLVVSGQPGPWCTDRVVVPRFDWEDHHYAYALKETRDGGPALIFDGKILGYVGARPEITTDGNLLSVGSAPEGESLLIDGQVVATGTKVVDITPAFVGPRHAAIIQQVVDGQPVNRLYLDGKGVPAGDYVTRVTFSPDGRRYAARLERPTDKQLAALIDGRRGGFAALQNAFSIFTADSTAVVSWVEHNEDAVTVFAAQKQYHYRGGFTSVTVSPKGNRQAWGGYSDAGKWEVIVDGQPCLPEGLMLRLPDDRYLGEHNVMFSPDGSRHAFTAVTAQRGGLNRFVIDGKTVSDVIAGMFEPPKKEFYLVGTTVAFSDGGRHVAYVGKTAASPDPVLYVDHTPVYRGATAMYFPTFSADQNHFSWIADEPAEGGRPASTVVYIDGEPAVRTNIELFRDFSAVFTKSGDGVAILGVDANVVKRYRVSPSPNRSIASLSRLREPSATTTSASVETSASRPAPMAATTPRVTKTPSAPPVVSRGYPGSTYEADAPAGAKVTVEFLDATRCKVTMKSPLFGTTFSGTYTVNGDRLALRMTGDWENLDLTRVGETLVGGFDGDQLVFRRR